MIRTSGWLILLFVGTAVLSGLLVGWSYIPTPDLAHASIVDLESSTLAGRTLRSLHFLSSHVCLVVTLAHLVLVLMTRAAFTRWISGLLCLVLLIFLAFTGRVLPWDHHGGASLVVAQGLLTGDLATSMLGTAPALKLQRVWLLHLLGTALLLSCLLAHVPLWARLIAWIRAPKKNTVAIVAGGLMAVVMASTLFGAPLGHPFTGQIEEEVSAEWYLRWLQGLAVQSTDLARLVPFGLLAVGLATPALRRRVGSKRIRGAWLGVVATLSIISLLHCDIGRSAPAGGDPATVGDGDGMNLHEWRGYQAAYNELQQASGRAPIKRGVRALRPLGGDEEQRCVSCHLGMALPDAHGPPFQAHPALACRMPVARLGCTGCHRGEPLRLTKAGAHGVDPPSRRQILGSRFSLQAGCAQCHLSRAEGVLRYDAAIVPDVSRGQALFFSQGCHACHRIDGLYHFGDNAPRLSRLGSRRTRREIRQRLLRPQRHSARSPMPPLDLPMKQTRQLVLFLQAQVGVDRELGSSVKWAALSTWRRPPLSSHFVDGYPAAPSAGVGALWVRKAGCDGCHKLGERDQGVPDLRLVGWTSTAREIQEMLARPASRVVGTHMPSLELPHSVVESVGSFLALQKHPLPSSPKGVLQQVCNRCHGVRRDPKSVVLAKRPPLLKRILSRATFLNTVSTGRTGSAMAPWGRVLSRGFIEAVYQALRENQ